VSKFELDSFQVSRAMASSGLCLAAPSGCRGFPSQFSRRRGALERRLRVPTGWRRRQRRNPRGGRWGTSTELRARIVAENRHQGRMMPDVDYRRRPRRRRRASNPSPGRRSCRGSCLQDEDSRSWSMKAQGGLTVAVQSFAHHGAGVQLGHHRRGAGHLAQHPEWMRDAGVTRCRSPRALAR